MHGHRERGERGRAGACIEGRRGKGGEGIPKEARVLGKREGGGQGSYVHAGMGSESEDSNEV